MWCLVSQANSVILEVQVDPRAIGRECLEKVNNTFVNTTSIIFIYAHKIVLFDGALFQLVNN